MRRNVLNFGVGHTFRRPPWRVHFDLHVISLLEPKLGSRPRGSMGRSWAFQSYSTVKLSWRSRRELFACTSKEATSTGRYLNSSCRTFKLRNLGCYLLAALLKKRTHPFRAATFETHMVLCSTSGRHPPRVKLGCEQFRVSREIQSAPIRNTRFRVNGWPPLSQ